MLYFVGVGPELRDISDKALSVIKKSKRVFLEGYTNYIGIKKDEIEKLVKRDINELERRDLEDNMDKILNIAKNEDITIIIFGNPLFATTHFYYFIEGKRRGIDVEFIHCPSVFDLILEIGLHPYKFGKIASISFHYSETPYEILKQNLSINAHTLFLLDLDPRNNKFMKIGEAIERLIEIENNRMEGLISDETMLVGCARLGMKNRKIVYAEARKLMREDFGDPPYCLVYPAKELHFTEEEALDIWKI